jgi:hypothetical protein
MNIKRYASATEIELSNGTTVLVSYSTPVAAFVPGRGYVQSEEHYSRTTTKHIRDFLRRNGCSTNNPPTVPAAELAAMLEPR